MDTELVQADAILRIANTLEETLPLIEQIAAEIKEFTRVQLEAFELMKAREDEMRRAMSNATPDVF